MTEPSSRRPRALPGLVLWLVLVTLPIPSLADDAGVTRLRNFLTEVRSLEADFRQLVADGGGRILEESSGQVIMARPGRFRWTYREPFERLIVADGQRIWLYEADLDQVTVRRLQAGLGDTPAAILTGEEDVLERFRVDRSWQEGRVFWLALRPVAADADFAEVRLGFDGRQLTSLELDDRLGQRTRVELSAVRLNPAVDPGAFRFDVPPGVDVIDDAAL